MSSTPLTCSDSVEVLSCVTIIPQSHLIEIVYLICWSNGVLWNRYFLSELFFQSLYFLRSATFSKQLLFHKSYFFLLTVLFIIESFQSLKKPGVYRVVHPSENSILNAMIYFLQWHIQPFLHSKNLIWNVLRQICFFRAALKGPSA